MITQRRDALLLVLGGLQNFYHKNYCYPSQCKILELLAQHHKIKVSLRTLNRDLLQMSGTGLIHRVRRFWLVGKREKRYRTTAYYLLQKASNLVKSLAKALKKLACACRVPFLADYLSFNKENKGIKDKYIGNLPPPRLLITSIGSL